MDYIHALHGQGPRASKQFGWLFYLGILNILLGLFAVVFTDFSTYFSVLYIGWLLIFSGTATFYFSLQLKEIGGHWSSLIFSVLAVVFGALMLVNPLRNELFLTLLAATFMFVTGSVTLFSCYIAPFRHRGWVVFSSAASIACSVMIYAQWPTSGAWVLGTLFGVYLILHGMTQARIGSSGKSNEKIALPVTETVHPPAKGALGQR